MAAKKRDQAGLSIRTLVIAACASAVAAFVIPMVWRPGTVFAAAAAPVIVALVTEALKRPVEAVSAVRVRKTERGALIIDPPDPEPETEEFDPLAPPPARDLEQLPQTAVTPRHIEQRRRRLTARQWRIALVTGLIAFAVAAAVVTASELAVFGDSVSTGRDRTTFFGGRSGSSSTNDAEEDATPTPTATSTGTPTGTATPDEDADRDASPTPTPTGSATATPGASVTPGATATATATAVPSATATPAP